MATVIFVDQENNAAAPTLLSKDRLKLSNNKPLKGLQGKVFGSVQNTSRKALGNVNKQVVNQKAVPSQKRQLKVKEPVTVSKKASEPRAKQIYPEIEKFIPYDPKDFERFDVPEEHKLSHLSLAGVPLIVNEEEVARFDALLNRELSPVEMPSFSWDLDTDNALPSLLATLDDITLDLPPMLHC